MEVMKVFKVTMCMVLLVLCVGGIIYYVQGMKDTPKAPDPMQEFNSRIEQNYTAYLDGEEVDPVTLDVKRYSVTYNDEAKAIYLTKREETSGNGSLYVFVFLILMMLIWYVPTRDR